MDMNALYFELVNSVLSYTQITTDNIHIIQQITLTLNQLRFQTMN